jgi:type I restriction enzyme S subunit
MALLDCLEAKRQDREVVRTAAQDSALAVLRDAPTPEDVEAAWLRVQDRFHELFAIPEDVESLRQTILQLAVRGRLVTQDPKDSTGASLLEQVEALRAKVARVGKRQKALPNQDAGERITPFQTPTGWAWARLGEILSECRNGLSTTPNDAGDPRFHPTPEALESY